MKIRAEISNSFGIQQKLSFPSNQHISMNQVQFFDMKKDVHKNVISICNFGPMNLTQ